MKENKIKAIGSGLPCVILSWIHTVLLFFGFYPFFADFAELTGNAFRSYTMLGFFLFIPAILSWVLLKRIRQIVLYNMIGFLVSLGLGLLEGYWAAGLFYQSQGLTTVFTFFVSMLMFVIHTSARIRHGNLKNDFLALHGDVAQFELEVWEVPNILSSPSPVALAWFAVFYLVGVLVKLTNFWHVAFYLTLAEVFVCFMYKCFSSFTDFLQKNHKSANIPVTTIKRVHKIFFMTALFLLTIFVLPSVLYNREPLSRWEPKEVTFDTQDAPPQMDEAEIASQPAPIDEMLAQADMEVKAFPEWVGIVVRIFLWGLVLLAFCVLIGGIIRSIKNAIIDFNVEDEDEIIFLDSEETDENASLHEQLRNDGILSANAQIRRRYKKTIKKATKGTPSCWATPTELEAAAQMQNTDSIGTLHDLYEKARYSKNGCTREDLSKLV